MVYDAESPSLGGPPISEHQNVHGVINSARELFKLSPSMWVNESGRRGRPYEISFSLGPNNGK